MHSEFLFLREVLLRRREYPYDSEHYERSHRLVSKALSLFRKGVLYGIAAPIALAQERGATFGGTFGINPLL